MSKAFHNDEPRELGNLKKLIDDYCSEEWRYLIDFYKKSRAYGRNEIIFKEGEEITHIHIIERGKAKIFSAFNNEKERIIRLAADDQVIGHRGLGEDFRYTVSAEALDDTSAALIPIELFKKVLKANAAFCYYFMLFFAEELKRSERHVKNMESMTALQKTANALAINLDAFGYDHSRSGLLGYTLSRKDLSSLTGSAYESVVRALSWLNDTGVIKTEGKDICILDEQKLRELIASPVDIR